jgi:hypothetical protein
MPDKMEREIEEILAKLDGDSPRAAPAQGEKAPVSILSRRKRQPSPLKRVSKSTGGFLDGINPTTLLFAGAGTMIAGLILSTVYEPLIWASFAGVVLFIAAFLWSFRRTPRPVRGGTTQPVGHYWRDRYIEYQPESSGIAGRIKRRFRR